MHMMSNTMNQMSSNNNNPLMNTASSKVFKSTDRKFSPISSQNNENKVFSNTTGSFYFLKRTEPLRWKEILKLDIDRMIRKNNLSDLEPHLQNLIFGLVDENDLEKVSDDSVVKLIKCFQYSLEFQFYYQQNLENHLEQMKVDYNNLYNDAISKENFLKENKNLIQILKKDKKEKEIVLHTYKALIDEFRRKNGIYNNSNNPNSIPNSSNITNYQPINKNKGYNLNECPFCVKKFFDTEENLNKHILRRHPNNMNKTATLEEKEKNSNDLNVSIIDRKINDLHKNFENYIKAFTDPMLNYVHSQKNIESQINEIKQESHYNKLDLENQVKNVLYEIKEMYINKSLIEKENFNTTTKTHFEHPKEQNEKEKEKYDAELDKLTSTLLNIKDQLDDIRKTQGVQKQALDFHTSQYLNDKKERERQNKFKDNNSSVNIVAPKSNNNEKKENKFRLTAESQISIKSHNNHNNTSKNKEIEYRRKQFFNSGPLESDHDDEELEVKVNPIPFKNIVKVSIEKASELETKPEKKEEEKPIIKKEEEPIIEIEKPVELNIDAEEKEQERIKQEIEKVNELNVLAKKKEDKEKIKSDNLLPPKDVSIKKIEKPVDPINKKKDAYTKLCDNFNTYMARDLNFQETGRVDMYKSIV